MHSSTSDGNCSTNPGARLSGGLGVDSAWSDLAKLGDGDGGPRPACSSMEKSDRAAIGAVEPTPLLLALLPKFTLVLLFNCPFPVLAEIITGTGVRLLEPFVPPLAEALQTFRPDSADTFPGALFTDTLRLHPLSALARLPFPVPELMLRPHAVTPPMPALTAPTFKLLPAVLLARLTAPTLLLPLPPLPVLLAPAPELLARLASSSGLVSLSRELL